MTLQQINQLNFEDVLQKLGFESTTKRGKSLFYISPFRPNEKTASFHVTKTNRYDLFYDHGNGTGGKIVDFFIKYLQTTPKGVWDYFNGNSFSFQQKQSLPESMNVEKNYEILELKEIQSVPLIQYLASRKLSLELTRKYCQEIHYTMNNRNYFAIAFPTEQGFEIRNKYVKMCLKGKGVSWVFNSKNSVKIFESWTDFLSYLTIFREQEFESDFHILNSVSLLKKQVDTLGKYQKIETFFDEDTGGKTATKFMSESLSLSVSDGSKFYHGFKDVNEFLIHSKNV